MSKGFDLYMVSIEWANPNQHSNILRGKKPLKPNFVQDTAEYDVVMYTKENDKYYQFAIATDLLPFVETTDSKRKKHHKKLYEIEKGLWIIKEEWREGEKSRYYYCPSINTQGTIDIVFSSNGEKITHRAKIDIHPNIERFDFDALKNDFEGELWQLITSNSAVKTGLKTLSDNNIAKFIQLFLIEFEKIAKNPKQELKTTTGNVPFNKVKPIPATFKKLAIAGTSALLPSKIVIDNYDIYENRYLCWMLYKIYQIVENNTKLSIQQENRLLAEIEAIKEKIVELQKPQIVKQAQVLAEIQAQEQRIHSLQQKWKPINNSLIFDRLANYGTRTIKILYQQGGNNYFGSISGSFDLFCFPESIAKYIESGKEYIFDLTAKKIGTNQTNKGKAYSIFEITNIKRIEGIDTEANHILIQQKRNIEILSRNNWQLSAILTSSELNKLQAEKTNQIQTLQKRQVKLDNQIKSLMANEKEMEALKPHLGKLLHSEFVKKVNFKKLLRVQSSMTYIQNPLYRNALKYYHEMLNAEGIDMNIFGLYEQLTNYGVREMPKVFELWSLVSIIRVLESTFSYKHDQHDLLQLLSSISPQNKNIDTYIKINFSGDLNGRSVALHYQKTLSNGKRPDFILEVKCGRSNIFVVLDAKFQNYNYKKSATEKTKEMIDKYKINADYYVFILHPCKDLSSAKLTNFGGEKVYFEDGESLFPLHKFGYLMIKPNETDNLKKIIGMSLEYLVEHSHNAKQADNNIDPNPEYEMICLGCGSDNVTKVQSTRGTNRHHYTCKCKNQDCEHMIYIDYCWNCKTKLFKHGSYWDYHRTSAWHQFDIHCPNCAMTLVDRPKS